MSEFGLVNSMIQTIWNRMKIIAAFEESGLRIKRFCKPEWSDIDGVLLEWFKQDRSDYVSVSSPFLIITSSFPEF